ncbi:MAG: MarR family transcriptional regulator [Bacilli bacterium]|nr:MarR family transcriptional regulator [Bacilli bacterium]
MNNLKLDADILTQIRHLSKCLRLDFDDKLTKHGLTCGQGRVLFYINGQKLENKEVHQSDIEKIFLLSKSTVSELVTRMIKNGLIERIRNKTCCSLIPTDKGKSIVDDILASRIKVIDKLFKGFNKEEIDNVMNYLERMTKNVEKEEVVCGKR